MLLNILNSGYRRCEAGAAMVEFALASVLLSVAFIFVIDAGIVLTNMSILNNMTNDLTRQLGVDLGHAWYGGLVDREPYNGSCNDYIRSAGAARLPSGSYSMSDSNAKIYFGSTLDTNTALVFGSFTPYAVLRITGRSSAGCVFCGFFPNAVITAERTALVEYKEKNCADY